MPTTHPAPAPTVAAAAADLFTMQPLGLVVSGNPTYEQWDFYGSRLFNIINASQWALGDWLNYGEGRSDWGEMWSQALDGTRKSADSMMSAMNVCRKFDVDRRRQALSFAHHREVAALPVLDQERFLDLAEQNGWSVKELREAIKAERTLANPPTVTEDGAEIHPPDDEVRWPEHLSSQIAIYRHPDLNRIALVTNLVFDGNVRLPRVWQQLERTAQERRAELERQGFVFVSSHDSWRAPSRRVLAITIDPTNNAVESLDAE